VWADGTTAEDVVRRFGPAKATVVDVARALGIDTADNDVWRLVPCEQNTGLYYTIYGLALSLRLHGGGSEDGSEIAQEPENNELEVTCSLPRFLGVRLE